MPTYTSAYAAEQWKRSDATTHVVANGWSLPGPYAPVKHLTEQPAKKTADQGEVVQLRDGATAREPDPQVRAGGERADAAVGRGKQPGAGQPN